MFVYIACSLGPVVPGNTHRECFFPGIIDNPWRMHSLPIDSIRESGSEGIEDMVFIVSPRTAPPGVPLETIGLVEATLREDADLDENGVVVGPDAGPTVAVSLPGHEDAAIFRSSSVYRVPGGGRMNSWA